jgi:radical SAM protein with 4Fe4S-binding SPASM domain
MFVSEARQAFDNILTKAEEHKIPLWAHLDLTFRCNLNCKHCYCQGLSGKPWNGNPELSLVEIKPLLDELAEIGSLYLTLSGGEVLLRDDFFDIAGYAKKKNFCLNIFTNGTLIDEDAAQRLAELLPLAVEMSIYGTTAEVHDAVTGVKGSFFKLLSVVSLLKKHRLKVTLKSVLMRANFHQARALPEFVKGIGADEYRFGIEVSPKNDGSKGPRAYQVDESQIYEFLSRKENATPENDGYLRNPLDKPLCGTGSIACYISPYGDVYPCIQLLAPMGNIRQRNFHDIWHAPSPLRSQLNALKTYKDMAPCLSCQYVGFCKKCIGLAYLEQHDLQACYDTLKLFSRIDYELSTVNANKHRCEL